MSSLTSATDPELPLGRDLAPRTDVLLVPWGTNEPKGARRAAGLFGADGAYMPEAACLRYDDDPLTIEPEFDRSAPVETLAGRWLFGGMMYAHFGHFLCESTGRLWALDHAQGPFDGVIWLPKVELGHPARLTRPYEPFFAALGRSDLALMAPQAPVRIEELVIPEQGFGIGLMAAGRPEYRAFMRQNLGRDIAPEGGARLYVSRANLPTKRGSVLLERRIEALMAAEGYEIIAPESLPVEAQIARYKAARQIVGLDGSALHLAAMVADPSAQVAIINRGPSQNIDDYARQFRHFAGIAVQQIEAIRAYWFEAGRRVVKRETHALLDFSAAGLALAAGGFIARPEVWTQPPETDLAAELAQREARAGVRLQRYEMAGAA
jgi:capsular polysaccharide biosynthesis protein